MPKAKHKSFPIGFTLIELVIVMILVGILSFFLAPVLLSGIDSWEYIHFRTDSINNARLAMHRMSREIRHAQTINTWTNNNLSFTDINSKTITFQQSGTTLLRNEDDFIDNLDASNGLQFSYLDINENTATTVEDIQSIVIDLFLDNPGGNFKIQNKIYLRNIDS